MSEVKTELSGPDLANGIALSTIADGAMLLGHAHGESALLARRGDELFAVGNACTHYGAPLNEGLLVDDTVRCPWHHACFSLRTGAVLRAPALNPISCWRVERRDGMVYVREKIETTAQPSPMPATAGIPKSVVIVGGGAAGNAAAEMLRLEGYLGRITLLSADESLPCDRPNLSKGYLAGTAPDESNPLRSTEFYQQHDIDVKLRARVAAIDAPRRYVELLDGSRYAYDALLLATGAEPVRLELPGGDLPHVHYLRTLADSRALVGKALAARRAVVIGASFIGLEVAASLRARNIEVTVVGRETCPMAKILGADVGNFIRKLHEEHDVTFHLGTTVTSIDARQVVLKNGATLPADLVVVGIGVRPAISLASTWKRASPVSLRPAISRAGRTGSPASGFVSNTGLLRNARGRQPRAICWVDGNVSTPFRSSGPSNTTSASLTLDTPRDGIKPQSMGSLTRETAQSRIGRAAGNWPSR
jgi:nitrite reductase/ring-hydroxylating ferredoxin subunit/thioredoxin reductase